MKPNGRRRWRKWAAKGLDIVSGYTARRLNKRRYWNRWRRHRNAVEVTGPLPPLVSCSRPFSPRSLVGMSNSHRKWLAQLKHLCLGTDIRIEMAFYRVGERLRSCPGCLMCVPRDWTNDFFLSLNPPCDGSGALPAQSKQKG